MNEQMLIDLDKWQFYFEQGFALGKAVVSDKLYKKYTVYGMGGSGVSGKILQDFFAAIGRIDLVGIAQYSHDLRFQDDSCPIFISYSGNTWETLHMFERALEQKQNPITISHGGALADLSLRAGLQHVALPQMLTPRSSLPLVLGVIFGLLADVLQDEADIHLFGNLIARSIEFYKHYNFGPWLELAAPLTLLHVWGVSHHTEGLAYRAVTQLNENAKLLTAYALVPELTHNLIVGFEQGCKDQAVLLVETDFMSDNLKTLTQELSKLLTECGVRVYKPQIFGDTLLHQMMSIVIWADFASVRLGIHRGFDTKKVRMIELLKQRLKAHRFS